MSKYIRAVVAAEVIADKYGIPLDDLADTFADIPAADVVPVYTAKIATCGGVKSALCFTAANAGSSTHGRRITTFAATEKG